MQEYKQYLDQNLCSLPQYFTLTHHGATAEKGPRSLLTLQKESRSANHKYKSTIDHINLAFVYICGFCMYM